MRNSACRREKQNLEPVGSSGSRQQKQKRIAAESDKEIIKPGHWRQPLARKESYGPWFVATAIEPDLDAVDGVGLCASGTARSGVRGAASDHRTVQSSD